VPKHTGADVVGGEQDEGCGGLAGGQHAAFGGGLDGGVVRGGALAGVVREGAIDEGGCGGDAGDLES
jgi:hypothetical protein